MIVKKIDHLLAGPVLGVDAGIDHQAYGAPVIGFQSAVVRIRVLVEANLLAQPLGVERPALCVSRIVLVLAEVGQVVQLLRNGDLQVMAGNALVIRDGFYLVEIALGGVIQVDAQTARPAAVRRARLVIGGIHVLRNVVGNRGNLKRSLGQPAKELRQLRLHRPNVAAIGCHKRLGRRGMQLGIGLQSRAKALQIREAQLLRNGQHLGLVLLHLVESDLVNLVGGQIGSSRAAYTEGVVLCPVGQRPNARLRAPCGNIAHLKKARKAHVSGQHFLADGVQRLGLDAFLFSGRDGGRKLLQRHGQRRIFRFLSGQLLYLFQRLFQ